MQIYIDLQKELKDLKKENLCEFYMDNAADKYDVHFVCIKWKEEAEIHIAKLIYLLKPLLDLEDEESHYVMFSGEREMILSFTLYTP